MIPKPFTMNQFPESVILVLGLTGAGKTTFINHVTGSSLKTGASMSSTTRTTNHQTTTINNTTVAFVDTPGFDDPNKSDAEILIDITDWLQLFLGGRRRVTAAIYLHSIATDKSHHSAAKNYALFSKLVGSSRMHNVALVITHWDVVDIEVGEVRESFLKTRSWSFMVHNGARVYRIADDKHSCLEVAQALLTATDAPKPAFIQIQDEMALEFGRLPLSRTEAGQDVAHDLQQRIRVARSEIAEIRIELERNAMADRESLVEMMHASQARIARFTADLKQIEKPRTWLADAVTIQCPRALWILMSCSTALLAAISYYHYRQTQTNHHTAAAAAAAHAHRTWSTSDALSKLLRTISSNLW